MTPYDNLTREQLIERLSAAEKKIEEQRAFHALGCFSDTEKGRDDVPMLSVDQTGKILFVNEALVKATGFSRREMLGYLLSDFSRCEHTLWDMDILHKMESGGREIIQEEHSLVTKGGQDLWVDVIAFAVRDANERLKQVLYLFGDIAKSKKNERELEDMLDAQKRISNALLLVMQYETGMYEEQVLQIIIERYRADRAYIFTFDWQNGFNRNISEVVAPGISREAGNLQHIPNSAILEPIAHFRRGEPFVLNNLKEETTVEVDWDKDILEAQEIKSMVLFPLIICGELWGYLGIDMVRGFKVWNDQEIEWLKTFANVLSVGLGQRMTMDKLDRQQEMFNLILDSGSLGYWTIDVRTGAIQCSENYIRLLGYEVGRVDLDLSEFWGLLHPDDVLQVQQFAGRVILGQTDENNIEFRILKKDGNWHWVLSKMIKVETDPFLGTCVVTGLNVNIDQTKQAAFAVLEKEAQLVQSEQRYAELFQSMNMGYAHCKVVLGDEEDVVDMIHIDVNPVYEKFMGISKEQLIGRVSGRECGHKFSLGLLELFSDVALNGVSRHYEYYSEQFKGWYSMSAYSHKQGEFVLLLNNITARHQAYETIRWNERKLRTIYDNIPIGISLYDERGNYLECNAGMLEMFGYKLGERFNILEVMCASFPEWDRTSILSMGFSYDKQTQRAIPENDSTQEGAIYLQMKVIPLQDESGDSSGYMVIAIDETENRRMQRSLMKARELQDLSNAMLSSVLDISHVLPWDCNIPTQTFSCDHSRYHHESQPEPINGKYYCTIEKYVNSIHPDFRARMQEVFSNLASGKETSFHEVYQVHWFNDREYEWIDKQGLVCEWDENGSPKTLIGSTIVITERKRMDQNLLNALEQAEQSNRLKSAFLANMSHEIRTPLNAIVGFSEIITNTSDPEERAEYAKIISNNNQLLLQLISDILDISKIEAGTLEFVYSNVDINNLLQDVERSFRMKVDESQVKISFEEFLPECVIHSEWNRLLQVINNLMTNAIKFTDKGSIVIGYRLEDEHSLRFYVTDTGCGIAQDRLPDVFGRFVKLNSFVQGTGLGLSICETIVNNLGGKIGVESQLGEGSTFWFTIPYKPILGDDLQQTEKRTRTGKAGLKPRILIAEDNESNYKLFESILQKNYTLTHAWTGLDVVEMYNTVHPDLILMDLNIPELSGLDATIIIREVSKKIPIIAVTAFDFGGSREQVLRAGCNDFLVQPVNEKELIALIEKYLAE